MVSDDIYLAPSETVAGWSGDQTGKMAEYVKHVFGGSYEYYEWSSIDTSGAGGSTAKDLWKRWRDQSFTDYDRNLLIASVADWGTGGHADKPGKAAVICITDEFHNLVTPSTDPNLVGDYPNSIYTK